MNIKALAYNKYIQAEAKGVHKASNKGLKVKTLQNRPNSVLFNKVTNNISRPAFNFILTASSGTGFQLAALKHL